MRPIALHPASHALSVPWWRRFGHRPLGAVLVLVAFVAAPGLGAWQLASPRVWVSPLGWVVLVSFGGLGLLACGLVAAAALEQVRGALKPGNWVAAVSRSGVWLNARSYLNWRLPPEDATTAFVPFDAIRSVREVREQLEVPLRARTARRYRAFVVLTLKQDVDSRALAERVACEIREVASRAGARDRLRFSHDVPVHVPAPDEIWVEWRGPRLLGQLGEQVRREARVSQRLRGGDLVAAGDERAIERYAVALVHRGERVLATDMLMFHRGLGHAEADARVSELLEDHGSYGAL
jgi:hypothetical protein